jgi:tRNA A-37 threonylcarbamoyl transferase component Bud32
MSLEIGQVFAGYTIRRVLGEGAMGTVYLAAHPRLPREDALKVLPADLTADPEFRARFAREAEMAAGLSHPHIVRIHDRGEHDGQFWISMDYVAGADVGRLLRERFATGMPVDQVVSIVAAVGSALDYAHRRGLLHRDVKPANILLSDAEGQARRVYLADFGVARPMEDSAGLTATDMAVGTVSYAAPEQLRGESVDGRADQYALACTAFHLLAGAPPYDYSNSAVVISHHVSAPPPSIGALRPELAGLDSVFATAMAKEPSGRFGSCGEFAAQLGQQLSPGPGPVPVPSPVTYAYARDIPFDYAQETHPVVSVTEPVLPPASPVWKRRTAVLTGALVGVGLLVAGGVFASENLLGRHDSVATAPSTTSVAPKGPVPNTGPFTGVFKATYSTVTSVEGQPALGATPTYETWGVRSACGSAGCTATASRLTGETMQVTTMVLDQVDGNWLAVGVGTGTCANVEGEAWETFTLQPHPDGTLVGQSTQTMNKGCANIRPVTFVRTGDVDVSSLPDPAALPPRVVSPAAGLHGRYRQFSVQPNGFKQQADYVARTDCLRTGDRCISLFHRAPASAMALVFGGGTWVYQREFDGGCSKGGADAHVKITVPFPMPQPPGDPIALISGHGREEVVGPSRCPSTDVDVKFTRIGD